MNNSIWSSCINVVLFALVKKIKDQAILLSRFFENEPNLLTQFNERFAANQALP